MASIDVPPVLEAVLTVLRAEERRGAAVRDAAAGEASL
jgi:hypothetical protein